MNQTIQLYAVQITFHHLKKSDLHITNFLSRCSKTNNHFSSLIFSHFFQRKRAKNSFKISLSNLFFGIPYLNNIYRGKYTQLLDSFQDCGYIKNVSEVIIHLCCYISIKKDFFFNEMIV